MSEKLLTRDEFNSSVLKRDGYKCVVCSSKDNVVVHHIVERKLFGASSGYFISNGATVCPDCHWKCETTDISTDELRKLCGITEIILPEHLVVDSYDKWGNPILPNGQRLKGELFYEENVQKALKEHLSMFTTLVKYPRSMHFLWSPNLQNDDRMLENYSRFQGQEIVVTIKMDGENSSLYRDHYHVRSLDSQNHPSRTWMKQFWGTIKHDIPEGWRICGENLFAKHSIHYKNLDSYFYGFSIWNEKNICLSWDETLEWFELLGITPVETIYRGPFNIETLMELGNQVKEHEGYVARITNSFLYKDFKYCLAKWVRKNHVRTSEHWLNQELVRNDLK